MKYLFILVLTVCKSVTAHVSRVCEKSENQKKYEVKQLSIDLIYQSGTPIKKHIFLGLDEVEKKLEPLSSI